MPTTKVRHERPVFSRDPRHASFLSTENRCFIALDFDLDMLFVVPTWLKSWRGKPTVTKSILELSSMSRGHPRPRDNRIVLPKRASPRDLYH